jgi:hypothetical protein
MDDLRTSILSIRQLLVIVSVIGDLVSIVNQLLNNISMTGYEHANEKECSLDALVSEIGTDLRRVRAWSIVACEAELTIWDFASGLDQHRRKTFTYCNGSSRSADAAPVAAPAI